MKKSRMAWKFQSAMAKSFWGDITSRIPPASQWKCVHRPLVMRPWMLAYSSASMTTSFCSTACQCLMAFQLFPPSYKPHDDVSKKCE